MQRHLQTSNDKKLENQCIVAKTVWTAALNTKH